MPVSHVCVPAPPGVFDGTGIWTAARVVQLAYLSLATSATVSASRRPAAAPVRRARGPCLGARLSLATRLVLRRQRQCLALIYASTSVVCVAPVVCAARGCVSLAYDGRSRKLYRLLGGPRGTAYADPTPNGNAAAQTVATGADCGQHVLVTPHRIWTLIQQVPSLRPAPTRSEPTSRPCLQQQHHPARGFFEFPAKETPHGCSTVGASFAKLSEYGLA